MNRFFIILFGALLINACGPEVDGKRPVRTPARGSRNIPRDQDIPVRQDIPMPEYKPGMPFVKTPEFENFKSAFERDFAGYVSLPPEQLFQIINAVPGQKTTWGCGKVQSNMAKASASLALGLAVNQEDVQDCNDVNDYPLLIDVKVNPDAVSIAENMVKLQTIGSDKYFRVGALPNELAGFINKRIPKGMIAKSRDYSSLDEAELINLINNNIDIKMPLITLNGVSGSMLHYFSVVGYSKDGDKLLVLNTERSGIERLESHETSAFLETMNVNGNKNFIKWVVSFMLPLKSKLIAPGSELPDISALDKINTFNVITFQKQ